MKRRIKSFEKKVWKGVSEFWPILGYGPLKKGKRNFCEKGVVSQAQPIKRSFVKKRNV